MVQPDRWVLFSMVKLLNTGKKVPVSGNPANLWIQRIVSSDTAARAGQLNYITPGDSCDGKCSGMVTV